MANNDLVRVEFSKAKKPDDQIVYKDLTANAANIIGTSYKGPAFVPQILFNQFELGGTEVRNTFINLLGRHRQNFHGHLYDEYSCYADSEAYDAVSAWFGNGGQYAYFTRALGIGSGIRNKTTGKMSGSGFNLSKNISSGTLDHKKSKYLNANDDAAAEPGRLGFVIRNITENKKSIVPPNNSNITRGNIDYFHELGITDNTNILTDVIMFASGVLPNLSNAPLGSKDTSFVGFSDLTSNHTADRQTNNFLNLRNFNPYNSPLTADNNGDESLIDDPPISYTLDKGNVIKKNKTPSNLNQLAEMFWEKGHLRYSSYPLFGFNSTNVADSCGILLSQDYNEYTDEEKLIAPDYNSFESEYQTAKTPWVTSQPINRQTSWVEEGVSQNRIDIHEYVENLFRFWSLDDGEVGNRFRIKINIKKRGDTDVDWQSLAANVIDHYAVFDLYIFEYDPRINDYIDTKFPDVNGVDRSQGAIETYLDLNLNPDSDKYIGREIGTQYTYYDFNADKLVTKGRFRNKSSFVRVELTEKVESKEYDQMQHMLIPSGFRSYPHIELKKEGFSHYHPNLKGVVLDDIFDTQEIKHLPPLYALNYYKDEVLDNATNIENNWGVVFTEAKIKTIPIQNIGDINYIERVINSKRDKTPPTAESVEDQYLPLSPHYYYTKYFMSGIQKINSDGDLLYSNITINNVPDVDTTLNFISGTNSVEFNFVNNIDTEYAEVSNGAAAYSYSILVTDASVNDIVNRIIQALNVHNQNIYTQLGLSELFGLEVEGNTIKTIQKDKNKIIYSLTSDFVNIHITNYFKENVWVEEDNYLNSFFHLEKIAYNNIKNQATGRLSETFNSDSALNIKNMVYKHSGGTITTGNNYEYIDLSPESIIWDSNSRELDYFYNKLSFDFFTYGGFDGVDIRDHDKKYLKNDALIRELNDEENLSSLYGETFNSISKAVEIATDTANSETDILIVPGIKEIPIIRKCIDICENTKSNFFIADVSGACSNTLINFNNQTSELDNSDPNNIIYDSKTIKTSLGVMGRHILLSNNMIDYTRDKQLYRAVDDRFILTNTDIPLNAIDEITYYSYEEVLKRQLNNIISLWPTLSIESKYFFPVLGDTEANFLSDSASFKKKISPEVFVLGLIAGSPLRNDLTELTSPNLTRFNNLSFKLINERDFSTLNVNFEDTSVRIREAGINIIYRNTEPTTIKLLSQNTSYEVRNSLFRNPGVVRTIQSIKKRIMYDIFLNQTLVRGGFFFSNNANLENLYDKLNIQLNTLLSEFVTENLITDFKVKIPKMQDDKTLLDMQNYILRGNIILQMTNSDTIDLTLDDILGDLSLIADPSSDAVLLPEIPNI